jgi:YHS domain-containing protein
MFKFLKREVKKDPICGMVDDGSFTSKYGKRFCSESCIEKYENKNNISSAKDGGSCCGN